MKCVIGRAGDSGVACKRSWCGAAASRRPRGARRPTLALEECNVVQLSPGLGTVRDFCIHACMRGSLDGAATRASLGVAAQLGRTATHVRVHCAG